MWKIRQLYGNHSHLVCKYKKGGLGMRVGGERTGKCGHMH